MKTPEQIEIEKEKEKEQRQLKCRHNWLDMGKNSSIKYSKCLICGLTVYYSSD